MIRELSLIFIALIGISAAIVCTPNFCDVVRCAGVSKENCTAEGKDFRPKSTMCNCCDQCIDYLDFGEKCGIQGIHLFLVGGPPVLQRRCRPGLCCINNVCC